MVYSGIRVRAKFNKGAAGVLQGNHKSLVGITKVFFDELNNAVLGQDLSSTQRKHARKWIDIVPKFEDPKHLRLGLALLEMGEQLREMTRKRRSLILSPRDHSVLFEGALLERIDPKRMVKRIERIAEIPRDVAEEIWDKFCTLAINNNMAYEALGLVQTHQSRRGDVVRLMEFVPPSYRK